MKFDENDFNNTNPSTDDIADYYRNLEEEESITSDTDNNIEKEYKDEQIIDSEVNTNLPDVPDKLDSEQEFIRPDDNDYVPYNVKKRNIIFFIVPAAAAFIVLLCVFFAGIFSNKAEEDINFELAKIRDTSQKYAEAQKNINDGNSAIEDLNKEISEKQAELNTITEYESNTGELKSKLNVLNDEMNDLNNEISSREESISDLDSSISKKSSLPFNLTPGVYTAGKNVITGSFNVTGDGILTVSTSDGSLKINTVLTSEPFTCQLNDGDILKLETNAAFVSVQ